MTNMNKRLAALECRHFGNKHARSVILMYGGDDTDLIGYETQSGLQIARRTGESVEGLYERAVMAETKRHPEKSSFPIHEIYSPEYWEGKPEWLVSLFKIELRGMDNEH